MSLLPSTCCEWLDADSSSDIRSVLTVFRQSFLDPWRKDRLLDLLQRPDLHGIILRIDGLICGCLLYHFNNPVQEICTLGVLSDARRLGIGTMLIRQAQYLGLAMELTVVAIPEGNTPAQRCFEKSGFKFTTRIRDHFGEGIHAQLLRWHCPDSPKRAPHRGRKKS